MFDAQTTSPVIDHTYTEAFDGSMQVRVTDTAGGLGSASVPVRIGQPAPVVPVAPTVTVAATDTQGQVTLSWSGSDASQWVISVNDFPLGYTTGNPVTITDIPRDRDVTFTVTPMGEDGTLGDPGSATLASGATASLYSEGDLTLTNTFTVAGQDGSVVTAGDLTIVSDGLSTIGTFNVTSADGKAHELRIVSQGPSGVEVAAAANVDPLVHVSLEAVGKVTVHSGADMHASVRAGTFRSDGTGTFRAP